MVTKQEKTTMKRFYSIKETGEYLGLSHNTVRKLSATEWRRHGVKTYRLGNKVMFDIREIEKMVEVMK